MCRQYWKVSEMLSLHERPALQFNTTVRGNTLTLNISLDKHNRAMWQEICITSNLYIN